MAEDAWVKEFPGTVVVSDTAGTIVNMNDAAAKWFADKGGRELIGKSLFEVHKEASQEKIRAMIASKATNVYTIERECVRYLIFQSPWYRDGTLAGLVEFVLQVPEEIPHHARPSE